MSVWFNFWPAAAVYRARQPFLIIITISIIVEQKEINVRVGNRKGIKCVRFDYRSSDQSQLAAPSYPVLFVLVCWIDESQTESETEYPKGKGWGGGHWSQMTLIAEMDNVPNGIITEPMN